MRGAPRFTKPKLGSAFNLTLSRLVRGRPRNRGLQSNTPRLQASSVGKWRGCYVGCRSRRARVRTTSLCGVPKLRSKKKSAHRSNVVPICLQSPTGRDPPLRPLEMRRPCTIAAGPWFVLRYRGRIDAEARGRTLVANSRRFTCEGIGLMGYRSDHLSVGCGVQL